MPERISPRAGGRSRGDCLATTTDDGRAPFGPTKLKRDTAVDHHALGVDDARAAIDAYRRRAVLEGLAQAYQSTMSLNALRLRARLIRSLLTS